MNPFRMQWIAPAAVLAMGVVLFPKVGGAKPDYTRRTGQTCEYCHPPNSRALNDAGEYYAAHKRSLAGYKPKQPMSSKDKNAKAGEAKAK